MHRLIVCATKNYDVAQTISLYFCMVTNEGVDLMESKEKIYSNPIVIEQIFNTSAEKLWLAITDENQMLQWFFGEMSSFKPVVGFKTKFNVRNNETDYLHAWEVLEVLPGKKIVYSWKYPNYKGDSFVSWELFEENDSVLLKFTHTGIETFPKDNPDFSRESCSAGWNYFIGNRLKQFIERNK